MSANESNRDQSGDREARLRVDGHKVANARILLTAIDAGAFGPEGQGASDGRNGLIARIVTALFARG